jgi:hypothetical protein
MKHDNGNLILDLIERYLLLKHDDIRNKLIRAARNLGRDKTERAISACRDVVPGSIRP